jgi:hypothetical protein
MYGKLLFAAGLGLGYLAGTSRGRKDYEKLKLKVSELWLDPRVQRAAKQATDVVEKNVPMGEKVTEAAAAATKAARANVGAATAPASPGSSSASAAS